MPTANAYRRAPLIDTAYQPLSDGAVHLEGHYKQMTDRALQMVDVEHMTSLDAVLATKLGGYAELPPMPDIEGAVALLPGDPSRFMMVMKAAAMLAVGSRDKEALLRVLEALKTFLDVLPTISEDALYWCGADALRLAVELYRRTGQPFLLTLLESLRAQLPDVSGLMHVFPFQREYQQNNDPRNAEEQAYYERMQRFANGRGMAEAISMTTQLAQYSGSGRDQAAAEAGLTALLRYHGMPCGAFSADPYLAGRDPARAVELTAVCAQIEACLDALCLTGNLRMAERLELLMVNALPDLLTPAGVRDLQPTNRLADDDSCAVHKPEPTDVTAVLRGLYALRRAVWLGKDDETVAYMLPVDGGCLTRMNGVPVRLTAETAGVAERKIVIRVECRQAVSFNLQLRIPAYADSAVLSVCGGKAQAVAQGGLHTVTRTFQNGDVLVLTLTSSPRLEAGYRGSMSVFCGSTLMALALPEPSVVWRYGLVVTSAMSITEEDGQPFVLLTACEAPQWKEKAGFILPPPGNIPMGPAYELTLIPYAGTDGRIAAFPCVRA